MANNTMLLLAAVAGGFLLLNRSNQSPGTPTLPPPQTGGGIPGAEISGLNIVTGNPFDKEPGQTINLTEASFNYRGPAQVLNLWVALKPRDCPGFGCDFNNGDNIVPLHFGIFSLRVGESSTFLNYRNQRPTGLLRITVPRIDVALLARGGHTVTFGAGNVDVWIGITPLKVGSTPFVEGDMLVGPDLINGVANIVRPLAPAAATPPVVIFQ